jgi:hypothetical protein
MAEVDKIQTEEINLADPKKDPDKSAQNEELTPSEQDKLSGGVIVF